MKPVPVVFHIGPLQIHTYGIGLAITFWFAFRYFERRLRTRGYPWQWLTPVFLWIVVAAVVGARVMHVLANLGDYTHQPLQILAVWHGGLSSFGGLLFAIPVGIVLTRRRCPSLSIPRALDLVAPVLVAAWALGRLLGPQLMVAGGGHPTHQWFGMYYASQQGKRLPVPIFQAIECTAIYLVVLRLERYFRDGPDGMIIAAAAGLWGVSRFFDEFLWLSKPHSLGTHLVEGAGLGFAVIGFAAMGVLWRRRPAQAGTAQGDAAVPIDGADPPGGADPACHSGGADPVDTAAGGEPRPGEHVTVAGEPRPGEPAT